MAADDRDDLKENENENANSGQALDDLTVLSDVGTSDMGLSRLNLARPVEVDDAKLGSLATVHQGSESAPEVLEGAMFTTGEIAIDTTAIDSVGTISQVDTVASIESEAGSVSAAAESNAVDVNSNAQADLSTENIVFGDSLPSTAEDIQGVVFADDEAPALDAQMAEQPVNETVELDLPPAPVIGGISIDDPSTPEFDPSPVPTPLHTLEDQVIRFGVDVSGGDGNALTYEFSTPANGQVIPDPDFPGYYLFIPDQDWHGTDRFVVTVRDSFGRSAQQIVDLNVAAVADAPDAQGAEFVTGAEDTALALDLKYDLAQFESLHSVTITGAPAGSVLVIGDDIVTADEDGNLVLSGEQLAAIAHVGDGNVVTLDGVSILPPKDFDGTFNIDVTATSMDVSYDGTETFASSTHTMQVDVAGTEITFVNDGGPLVVEVSEDGTAEGTVQAVSADGDTLTYALLDADGNPVTSLTTEHGTVTIDPTTGEFTFTPSEDNKSLGEGETASDQFSVVAIQGDTTSSPQIVDVTITGTNDEPTITTVTRELDVGQEGSASGTVTGSDIDANDTVSYYLLDETGERVTELTTETGTVTIDTATGEYTFTPNDDAKELGEGETATDGFKVVAFDGIAESAPQDVGITITGSNDGPVVTASLDDASVEQDGTFTLDASAAFRDTDTNDVLTYSATLADGSPLPAWLEIDPETGKLSGSPENGDVGELSIVVTATDSSGASASSDPFNVTVDNVNDAPVVNTDFFEAVGLDQGDTFTLDTSAAFTDADIMHGDVLTYSATLADGSPLPAWLEIDPETGKLSGSPENGDVGELSIVVTATDSSGASASSDPFNVTVDNVNDAPVVNTDFFEAVGLDQGDTFTLDTSAAFTDADIMHGDVLTYSATLADGSPLPAWLEIDPETGKLSGSPENGDVGELSIVVTATDSSGASASSDPFNVTVDNVNDAPVVTSYDASLTVDQDSITSGTVAGSDVDAGDVVSYFLVSGDDRVTTLETEHGTVTIEPTTGEYTFTPNDAARALGIDDTADNSFQVVAVDRDGAESDPATVGVTITGTNDEPVVTEAVDLGGIAEDSTVFISVADLLANASDIDGDTLSVTNLGAVDDAGNAVGTFEAAADEDGNAGFIFTPNENYSGSITLNYEVSDGIASVPASAVMDIEAVADAPELSVSLGTPSVEASTSSVSITNHVGDAGYNNSYGYYIKGEDGAPVSGKVIWGNIKDDPGATVTIDGLDPDQVGFFVIPDGDRDNVGGIDNGLELTFQQDSSGKWSAVTPDGAVLKGSGGANVMFSDSAFNPDGKTQLQDTADRGNQNWEDISSGGDRDFNDANFSVSWESDDSGSVTYPLQIETSLTDTDGSESLAIVVAGLPESAVLSAGTDNGDGTWTLTPEQLDGLTVTVPEGTPAFDLSVTATSTEASNGDTASVSATVAVDVSVVEPPVDDGPMTESVTVAADVIYKTVTETYTTTETQTTEVARSFDYDGGGRNANNLNANSLEEALEAANGNNHETGDLVFKNVNNSSFNINGDSNDLFVVQGNSHDANINLGGGNNVVIFETDPGKNVNINVGSGSDVLVLPGNQADYNTHGLNNNNGVFSGQIAGPDNMSLTINNFDAIGFADGAIGDTSLLTETVVTEVEVEHTRDVQVVDEDAMSESGAYLNDAGVWVVDHDVTIFGKNLEDDTLQGTDGADVINAGAGNDVINAGAGDDIIVDAAGNDVMLGGDGDDTFLFDFGGGHDYVDGGAGGDWVDTIDLSNAMGEGVTMTINSGDESWTVTADNALDGAIDLGQDASGEVILTNAAGETQTIEFENIEQIKW